MCSTHWISLVYCTSASSLNDGFDTYVLKHTCDTGKASSSHHQYHLSLQLSHYLQHYIFSTYRFSFIHHELHSNTAIHMAGIHATLTHWITFVTNQIREYRVELDTKYIIHVLLCCSHAAKSTYIILNCIHLFSVFINNCKVL